MESYGKGSGALQGRGHGKLSGAKRSCLGELCVGPSHLGGWGYDWGAQGEHKGLTEGIGGRGLCLVGWGAGEEVTVFQGEGSVPHPRGPELPGQQEAGETESTGSRLLPTPSRPSRRRHGRRASLGAQLSSHSCARREFWGAGGGLLPVAPLSPTPRPTNGLITTRWSASAGTTSRIASTACGIPCPRFKERR